MTHGRPILRATAIALLATLAVLCPASLVAGLDRAWEAMLYGVVAAGYLLVGLTIMERRPDNRIGALAFGLGAGLSIVIVATIYAGLPGPPPGHGLAAWTASILDAPVYAAGALLFLLFPTGRLPSRRWAFVAIPAAIPAVLEASTRALAPGPFPLFPTIDNPLGIDGFPTELGGDALVSESIVALAVFVTPTVLAFLAPVARWPGASRIERAQLKWIGAAAVINVFALAVYIVVAEAGGFTRMGDLAVGIGAAAFPVAIGIAIHRYRLFDIDRLISRSVGWGIVTGLLGGSFVILVVGLQGLLAQLTGGSSLAVAVSTLVVAVLFSPVRSRVQRAVDLRFDRSRYDGEQLVAAFGDRLRDEVDLATITTEVLTTVDAAVRPSPVGLWLREREVGRT